MSLEDKIIKKLNSSFLKPNKNLVGIGDDCAYLGLEDLLISTDTFIENTHFDLKKSSPVQVAKSFLMLITVIYKALVVDHCTVS